MYQKTRDEFVYKYDDEDRLDIIDEIMYMEDKFLEMRSSFVESIGKKLEKYDNITGSQYNVLVEIYNKLKKKEENR